MSISILFHSSDVIASSTEVQPNDKSLEYLRYIFGDVVNSITGGTGPTEPDSMLGALSEVLNAGMLVFTSLVLGYVFLTGVLNSAHEGNPLGKMYNSMWVPLRMVVALSLMLPFSGGYSTMQIGVLRVAGLGIGQANAVWARALDHMTSTGALYPPIINIDYEEIAGDILLSRVCLRGINETDNHNNIEDKPVQLVSNVDNSNMAISSQTTSISHAPSHIVRQRYDSVYNPVQASGAYVAALLYNFSAGVPRHYGSNPCGSVTLEFAKIDQGVGLEEPINTFQQSIIQITADLDEKMDQLAITIIDYAEDDTRPQPDLNSFNSAVQTYKSQYESAVNQGMSGIATVRINKWANGNPDTSASTLGARDAGWISIGAWYWDFQRINTESRALTVVKPTIAGPTELAIANSGYAKFDTALQNYKKSMNVVDKYGRLVNALERSSYEDDGWTLSAVLNQIQNIIDLSLTNPDPVTGMANVGHYIIGTIEIAYTATIKVYIANDAVVQGLDTKGGLIPSILVVPLAILKGALGELLNLIKLAGVLLMPIAIMLAFYLPATPIILWIMGVCSWFVLLIEAIIAAPIWAASHAMPEGEGFVGQRAMAGYMVILSLFLRPTLMIFGFFASMVLMIVMGKVVLLLFIPAMSSMNGGNISGLVTLFAMLGILTTILIQLAHRTFGLIHEVPDKVLRYIGGGAENLGESSHEQQGRNVFIGGVGKALDSTKRERELNNKDKEGGKNQTIAGNGMSKLSNMLK